MEVVELTAGNAAVAAVVVVGSKIYQNLIRIDGTVTQYPLDLRDIEIFEIIRNDRLI